MKMRLEDEISQKKFKNEKHKLLINLIYTHGWIAGKQKNFFSDYDLTGQQFNILRILRGQYPKPSTLNLLKERMLDKMSDASRLVDRLKQKNLVERLECKNDRRAVDILITQKGLDLLAEIDQKSDILDNMFTSITEDEAQAVNDILDRLRG